MRWTERISCGPRKGGLKGLQRLTGSLGIVALASMIRRIQSNLEWHVSYGSQSLSGLVHLTVTRSHRPLQRQRQQTLLGLPQLTGLDELYAPSSVWVLARSLCRISAQLERFIGSAESIWNRHGIRRSRPRGFKISLTQISHNSTAGTGVFSLCQCLISLSAWWNRWPIPGSNLPFTVWKMTWNEQVLSMSINSGSSLQATSSVSWVLGSHLAYSRLERYSQVTQGTKKERKGTDCSTWKSIDH